MQKTRVSKELAKMVQTPPHGIHIYSKDDKLNALEAQITGPEGSPYENGIFTLEILLSEKYPLAPPSVKFLTKVYHPNIDDHGRICLDLIKMPPKGNWRPTIGLEGLLIAIRMLLESPNPDDPLMVDIANEYKHSRDTYLKTARKFTEDYAK